MLHFFSILLLFTLSFCQIEAQIFPQEGSKLCYRLIGFSFPEQAGAVKYKIEIASGNQTESTFEKNVTASISSTKNKKIGEVPSFGCAYTWRTVAISVNNVKTTSPLHHFSVKNSIYSDTSLVRLRVIKNDEKHQDEYIFIDGMMTLYDMHGKPIWFLPGADMKENQNTYPRDLKITPQGTITFHSGGNPYEITYAGDILWRYKGPGNTPFHHEFTRLDNGHYMGLIYEDISGRVPPTIKDSIIKDTYDSAGFHKTRLYSSIAEYDENSRLVWHWSGLEYINNSDLKWRKTEDVPPLDHDLHENSFFFDEKTKVIYLSLRNISRIIKIKYPTGEVLNTYGPLYEPGARKFKNDLFCFQHSCRLSQKGDLYLFNNNVCGAEHIPTIAIYEEPGTGGSELKKIWEYQCTVEGSDSAALRELFFHSGGCVRELPDQSMLVQMGKPYSKVFIVNRDKQIMWSAIPEVYNAAEKKWKIYTELYRASVVTRKELEKLIWNSEKTMVDNGML